LILLELKETQKEAGALSLPRTYEWNKSLVLLLFKLDDTPRVAAEIYATQYNVLASG
jgi:hypothetical protein